MKIFRLFKYNIFILLLTCYTFAQGVSGNETRYVRIGDLQSHFTAYGSEKAHNGQYYEGLKWPAQYNRTDNAVIKFAWYGIQDFTDASGEHWDVWVNKLINDYTDYSIYPIQLEQVAKYEMPSVYVDGENLTAPYAEDVDRIDPNIPSDRVVINKINTSSGITITRKIYAFSQQHHNDYFIKTFTYKNTGNIDYDDDIELTNDIKGLRFGWATRYSVSREGASYSNGKQAWGKFTWATRRGEEYANHLDDIANFTESTPLEQLDWIPCAFSWLGQAEGVTHDNIGAPIASGNGRLTAPQFAGLGVIHTDKSANDKSNDPTKINTIGWQAGDYVRAAYPLGDLRTSDQPNMVNHYNMLSGKDWYSDSHGGDNRYFETLVSSITDPVVPYKLHNDGGGTDVWMTYGPYDLALGDSITIVEVEGVNGLSRQQCEQIGANWLADNGNYQLPPSGQFANLGVDYGSTTNDRNLYKNAWVYTGADSLLYTFRRAISNYNMNYEIPKAPYPPEFFEVNSGGDKISLTWGASESESESNFAGYRVYRAIGKKDTVFTKIAEFTPGVYSYDDRSATRGQSYYYYVVSYTDGSNNTEGIANPTGPLESGKYFTMTNKAASLKRKAGKNLDDIRIVPNPYNIRAEKYQYVGSPDKIMFLEIPAYCKIKIYTERGDLVETINHNDGSGDEEWNSLTSSRQEIVSGVYIAYFEVTKDFIDSETQEVLYKKGESTFKKFVVIR